MNSLQGQLEKKQGSKLICLFSRQLSNSNSLGEEVFSPLLKKTVSKRHEGYF